MAKKKKNNRAVLVTSCVLAALIVAGSTFAWFTSKDEVTNRLTASAEYGVAIGETFQAPESWVPGQVINKDTAAVNTGNVDAFVRMWLTGKMRLLQQKTSGSSTTVPYDTTNKNFGNLPTHLTTDSSLINSGLTLYDASGNYYKTLSTTQAANPHQTLSNSHEGFPDTASTALSEVQAMQTSILAYAPTDAEYTYILKEETELPISVSVDNAAATVLTTTVPAGTLVHVGATGNTTPAAYASTTGTLTISATETVTNASGTGTTNYKTVYVAKQAHDDTTTFFTPQNVEAESFTPKTDGLYLFLRNESDANQADPEFSGYYRSTQNVVNQETNQTTNGTTVYYALNTDTQRNNRSEYSVKGATTATYAAPVTVTYDDATNAKNIRHVVPSGNLELFTAQYIDVADGNLKFFTNDDNTVVYAAYIKDDYNTGNDVVNFEPGEDVVVEINLSNIGTDNAQKWTPKGAANITDANKKFKVGTTTLAKDASLLTFYYNDDVEAGDTTAILVDSVKLNENVTNKAYLAFDFDLNVNLESIQVTTDENGNEQDTAVSSGWAATTANNTAVNTGATGAQTPSSANAEITKMSWS